MMTQVMARTRGEIMIVQNKRVRQGGIEPPAEPWKGSMLPLHH